MNMAIAECDSVTKYGLHIEGNIMCFLCLFLWKDIEVKSCTAASGCDWWWIQHAIWAARGFIAAHESPWDWPVRLARRK